MSFVVWEQSIDTSPSTLSDADGSMTTLLDVDTPVSVGEVISEQLSMGLDMSVIEIGRLHYKYILRKVSDASK